MRKFMVTVKMPKNPTHDPKNKITGTCPISNGICTDVTGEHHTKLHEANSIEECMKYYAGIHVTRVEEITS